MSGDLARGHVPEVVVNLPLGRQKTVQEPQVEVLESVKAQVLLVRGQSAEKSDVDVIIVAGDINKTVMDGIVLLGPNE